MALMEIEMPKLTVCRTAHHSVYGTWSDVHENQFIVYRTPAGDTCTVMMLAGYDYGGGINRMSTEVPLKDLEHLLNSSEDDYDAYNKVGKLVELHKTHEVDYLGKGGLKKVGV